MNVDAQIDIETDAEGILGLLPSILQRLIEYAIHIITNSYN